MNERTTKGLVQLGLDVEAIIGSAYPSHSFGGLNTVEQYFLNPAFSYKFSFISGRTVGQLPNCTYPKPLPAILWRYSKHQPTMHK
ncbi:MAG: hypothetical protein IPJ26_16985 [Bacteroidetes bacterium]|nr:hypothetical protein [Bacteroidota bacterium]